MLSIPGQKAERVNVAGEPLLDDGKPPDYADAFVLEAQTAIPGSAEELARDALEGSPAMRILIRFVHRWVLGFQLASEGTAGQIVGWRILASDPAVVHLETIGWFGRAAIVCRRTGPGGMHVRTTLWFDHWGSPAVWAVIGPLHRMVTPRLMERVADRGTP